MNGIFGKGKAGEIWTGLTGLTGLEAGGILKTGLY
jgi:hypothetical protein